MSNIAIRRRKRARGRWMKLRDNDLLGQYLVHKDMTQARLGRYAEVSRQFISQLVNGDKKTCTPDVAKRIEEALDLIPGTLFEPKESSSAGHSATSTGHKRATAA